MTMVCPDPAAVARVAEVRQWCRDGTARRVRLHAHVTQAEMGAGVGRDAVTVCRWETGQRMPGTADALRYGEVLDSLLRVTAA